MISKNCLSGILLAVAMAGAISPQPGTAASLQTQQTPPPAGTDAGTNHDASGSASPGTVTQKAPKAKSQEELNAYQRFIKETSPDEQIKQVEDFLLNFPQTELKEFAYQTATQAYQSKNDYEKILTYGELTLSENENNLVALLILCSAIPERTEKNDLDRDAKLTQAEGYAKRAMEELRNMPPPSNMTAEQWAQAKRDTESTPHASLGMIALIRENFPAAEDEFKQATQMASHPDPIGFYRLALCYSFEKKFDDALAALDKASNAGGVKLPPVNGKTRDLVAEARDYVVKSKAASEAPVTGTAPAQPAAVPAAAH